MNNTFGLFFPILLEDGAPIPPALMDSVDASLRNFMAYDYGTRYFNPAFGTTLRDSLGLPNSQDNLAMIKRDLIEGIRRWEKRLQDVNVELENLGSNTKIRITGVVSSVQAGYELNTII